MNVVISPAMGAACMRRLYAAHACKATGLPRPHHHRCQKTRRFAERTSHGPQATGRILMAAVNDLARGESMLSLGTAERPAIRTKPGLLAIGSQQRWSWYITKINASAREAYRHPDVMLDLPLTQSHSPPYGSDDDPCAEAQFKKLKYRPDLPHRLGCIDDSRARCQVFLHWRKASHRHLGIGHMVPPWRPTPNGASATVFQLPSCRWLHGSNHRQRRSP